MTIVSIGYAGLIDTVGLAQIQQTWGARYHVLDQTSCKVSGLVGGTRQVSVSTGQAGGWGVLDTVTADEAYALPEPSSGIEYFMVGLYRDWTVTRGDGGKGVTSISHVSGGTSLPSSMPTRDNDPGTKDFQPLALVSLAAGDTVPQVVYDLRAVGGPNVFNMSADLANRPNWLAYMAFEGYTIRTGNVSRYRGVNNVGAPTWIKDPDVKLSGPGYGNDLSLVGSAGWGTVTKVTSRAVASGPMGNNRELLLQFSHTSNSNPVTFDSTFGNVVGGDVVIGTVGNTSWRPPFDIPGIQFTFRSSTNASYSATGTYKASGDFAVIAGPPGATIGVRDDGDWSVSALITWTREA